MPLSATYDIAIVGSGFAGSLLAMIARRCGRSVLLLEKGAHPRFAIGESSVPLANLFLGELADRSVAAWTGDHWLLTGQPPSELEAIHSVSILEPSQIRAA